MQIRGEAVYQHRAIEKEDHESVTAHYFHEAHQEGYLSILTPPTIDR